jgi:uncharacterized protein (DUF488 family)
MEIYSIGFTQKSAEQFFGALRRAGIRRLMDIRLNNTSQLAAFAKASDLPFFLRELCDASYVHEPRLAPTQEMLDAYKKKKGDWIAYEKEFFALITQRDISHAVDRESFNVPTALLCSEPTAEHCHRRLVLEYLASRWGDVTIHHL